MKEIIKNKKVAFYTLGCKLNFSETSSISREFTRNGYEKVDFTEQADVYVINTCTVTELADKKCRNAIRRAIKKTPNSTVVAIGCYAQLKPDTIAKIEGVDLILGNHEKFKLFDFLNEKSKKSKTIIETCPIDEVETFHSSYSINDRTRSFLKIQDGCDYHCSYCTVPLARGKSRNNPISDIIAQANEIARSGVKEVVLTGVNIGDFGKSTNESFIDLLKELDKISGVERYRISSIEPNLLSDDIISFVHHSTRFVPHFHIPLQSGCDKILQLMQRRYNTELFKERVKKIKTINPNACIGVDVIIGFPGESDEDFSKTKNLLDSLNISYLHVFNFSERKNTKAELMPGKINKQIKNLRSIELANLSEKKRYEFYKDNIGKEVNVLFENQKQKGKMFGFSENYIKIEANYDPSMVDKIIKGTLAKVNSNKNAEIKIKDLEL